MRAYRYPIFLSILTVVLIILALAAEKVYFSDFEYRYRTRMFNKNLVAKEKIMEDCLNGLKPVLSRENPNDTISKNDLFTTAEKNRISLLEYLDNKLVYWSDNEFDVPRVYN